MNSVAILELAHHNEVLRAYTISLLSWQVPVSIFTNSWIYEQCYDIKEDPLINWHIKEESESSSQFVNRFTQNINNCQFIILTSLENGEGGFIEKSYSVPSFLVVHDVHTLFEYKNHLDLSSIKSIGRTIKHLLFGILKRRTLSANTHDYFILPSKEVHKYILSKSYSNDKFIVIPFAVNDEMSKTLNHKYVRITIPGIIDNKSRDYQPIIDALSKLEKMNVPVRISLLGKPYQKYGTSVVAKFKNFNRHLLRIETFNGFIPQEEFDKLMRDTDFLICPMNEIMKFGPVKEKNGYSCVSGNINDIIRFGLPALVPDYYPLPDKLKLAVKTYSSTEELSETLSEWIDNKSFNQIKEKASFEAFENNTKEKIGKLLVDIFNEFN